MSPEDTDEARAQLRPHPLVRSCLIVTAVVAGLAGATVVSAHGGASHSHSSATQLYGPAMTVLGATLLAGTVLAERTDRLPSRHALTGASAGAVVAVFGVLVTLL